MPYNENMLNQVQLATVNPTVLYTPPRHMIVRVEYIIVCMYGNAVTDLTLYYCNNGTTANNTTIIMPAAPFQINVFQDIIPLKIYMNTIGGNNANLIAMAETADMFNITLFGSEIK